MLHTQYELNSLSISRIVLLSTTVHPLHPISQGKTPLLSLAELLLEPHPLEISLISSFRHQSSKQTERRTPSCKGKKQTLMEGSPATCEGSQTPV